MEQQSYGCLMCEFDIPNWDKLVTELVDTNDLHEYGLEKTPHATILWGLQYNISHLNLKNYLMPSHHIKVEFNKIDIFENEDFDVLKFNCSSDGLNSLHETLKHYFDNSWDHPEYNAHVTIAYLKSGTGKKYIKELENKFTLIPSKYVYQYPNNKKEVFDVDDISTDETIVVK